MKWWEKWPERGTKLGKKTVQLFKPVLKELYENRNADPLRRMSTDMMGNASGGLNPKRYDQTSEYQINSDISKLNKTEKRREDEASQQKMLIENFMRVANSASGTVDIDGISTKTVSMDSVSLSDNNNSV